MMRSGVSARRTWNGSPFSYNPWSSVTEITAHFGFSGKGGCNGSGLQLGSGE